MEFLHTVRDMEALPATRALLPSYFTPFSTEVSIAVPREEEIER